MKPRTLRFRMMLLFCSVVGVLLTASYLAFWALLAHEIPGQLNRVLLETARPLVADIASEPNARDVERLDIPGQFFEILDAGGNVLQRSKNLSSPIDLKGFRVGGDRPTFVTGSVGNAEAVRVAVIPFRQNGAQRAVLVAIPTIGTNRVLDSFAKIAVVLFPLSLLITGLISAFYVGKSLEPVNALTQHAELMAKRVTSRQGFWTPLTVSSPHDELGRLAHTFNRLLESVDSSVRQLRQFVTDASHELRTPLAVLHGETELILSKPRSDDEYRKTLAAFDDELKKLTRIVEGLFTLSMADAGQLHLQCEPLYLNEVLEEACALVSSRARVKNITIKRELDAEMPYYGDEAFLRELFVIFLDNAIKYSAGGTQIQVSLKQTADSVCVQFKDQGVGIPREHLPFIFERFYRAAPNGDCDAHSGGLGLAIAKAITGAQGGSVGCESQPGVGSTFTITLPIVSQSMAEPVRQAKRKLILG